MLTLRSPREIEKMRKPCQLVREAHERTATLIAPGVSTREIDQVVEDLFAEHGAEPLFKGYPGVTPFPAVTCISTNEEVVHGIPGDRLLRDGDIVSIDTGCRIDGWCGDAAVTHAVGEISTEAHRLLEATRQVLDLAIQGMAECEMWSQVTRRMQDYIDSTGFSIVRNYVGHGIGKEMHESPQVPNYYSRKFEKDEDFPLRPGLVLAIEPMINAGTHEVECLDDDWTIVTKDRKLSAHFEHTVALTAAGPVRLTGDMAT